VGSELNAARYFLSPRPGPIIRIMVSSIVLQYTELLRAGEYDLWVRLRELPEGQALDPDRTVVVDLLAGGPDHEDGQVLRGRQGLQVQPLL
jgi:hypothetical protein